MPNSGALKRVLDGVDKTAEKMTAREEEAAAHNYEQAQKRKGPLDRIKDLQADESSLKKRIAAGKSGDGLSGPDLNVQLRTVQGELRNLRKSNPGK